VFFNAGYNQQVFSPKCWKKSRRPILSFSRKTQSNSEKRTSPSRRL